MGKKGVNVGNVNYLQPVCLKGVMFHPWWVYASGSAWLCSLKPVWKHIHWISTYDV